MISVGKISEGYVNLLKCSRGRMMRNSVFERSRDTLGAGSSRRIYGLWYNVFDLVRFGESEGGTIRSFVCRQNRSDDRNKSVFRVGKCK